MCVCVCVCVCERKKKMIGVCGRDVMWSLFIRLSESCCVKFRILGGHVNNRGRSPRDVIVEDPHVRLSL